MYPEEYWKGEETTELNSRGGTNGEENKDGKDDSEEDKYAIIARLRKQIADWDNGSQLSTTPNSGLEPKGDVDTYTAPERDIQLSTTPIEETGPEEIPTPARTVPMPSESTTRHEVLGSGELLTTILPATERVTEPVARKGGTPSTVAQAGTTHQGLVITPTMYNLNSTTMGKSDPPSGTAKLARQIEGINDKWISTVPSPARTGAAGNLQFQDQDDGGSRDWIDAIDHSQQETHLGSSEPDSPSSDDDCDNKRMPPVENQEISQTLCNKCKEPQTPRYTFVKCSGCKRAFHSACLSFSSYSMCDSCVQAGKSSPERTDDSSTTTDESEKEYKSNNRANRRESPPTRSTTRHSPTNNSKAGIADPAKPPTSEIDNSDIRSQIESQSSTTTSTSQRVSSEPKAKSQASLVNFGFSQN